MRIRTFTGVSIDGFMATPDGVPVWDAMPGFVPGESYDIGEFIEQCEAIIIGRTTFDAGHAHWTNASMWPWEGKRVYVLTSRPLPENVHADVHAPQGGPAGLVEELRRTHLSHDVQLLGGARTIRAFLQIGAVDELGICVLPILLGDGVSLFAAGTISQAPQRLERHRDFSDGAVQLVYSRA